MISNETTRKNQHHRKLPKTVPKAVQLGFDSTACHQSYPKAIQRPSRQSVLQRRLGRGQGALKRVSV